MQYDKRYNGGSMVAKKVEERCFTQCEGAKEGFLKKKPWISVLMAY